MPLIGKPRASKRSSSSSSYVSTISMVVFIALCVLGLWMLTSSSVYPPQNIQTRNAFSSTSKSNKQKDPPAFEDSQGDLPDDAIKNESDELKMSANEDLMKSHNTQQQESSENKNEEEEEEEEQQQQQQEKEEVGSTINTNAVVDEKLDQKEASSIDEAQQQQQKEKDEDPIQNQQDSEMETRENPNQKQRNTEVETRDFEHQNLQDPEVVTHESTHHQETGEEENPQLQKSTTEEDQIQQQQQEQESSSTTTTTTDETHEQNSEPEIREVTTSDESQQEQQTQLSEEDHQQPNLEVTSSSSSSSSSSEDENQQQTQTNTEDQQTTTSSEENTETKNEETQKSENETQQQETAEEEKQSETNTNTGESFPGGAQSAIPKESSESKGSWSTQADQSVNQKERRKDGSSSSSNGGNDQQDGSIYGYTWHLCNVTAGQDYIPCLDNEKAIKMLHYTGHFEHRERHCPEEGGPTCLVPMPSGYKQPIEWPQSRDKIWYHNVPHPMLAEVKGHQNWVKVTGEFLQFPGGGTQFIHGALHYIDFIQKSVPNIAWGKRTRVILDVGCGVASFGGYLFERDVLAVSFAPKDEHEAQVQFALERGIPAISAVMGSQRLPFPSRVFDLVHCARCRVPWHAEGGRLLLELNRVLRPGGYFVWSATPVYQKLPEDQEIWKEMSALTISMCWELFTIKKDKLNSIGAAVYRKPTSNDCYEQRKHNSPPMCKGDDDPNAAWYVPLQACIHRVPVDEAERGSQWPSEWPNRVRTPPYWLNSSQKGIYGKSAPDDFASDYEHWKRVVTKSYMTGLGISWANVRNVMDMRAVYGGFAAALKDLKVWVMNVVNVDAPDTLPIIYERGLFGIYHDWCESFSTYPRTYDLLHADQLFSKLKKRCNILPVIAEVDRIVRPGGKLIVRDESSVVGEIENILKSLHWEIHLTFSKGQEAILSAQKTEWRPDTFAASS